ncbi:hypothetical protein B0H17DRAFT_1197830 [Mycena rosella]|uniref:Uncharacterized protein n=1 Tax=Mycena rosella TaxID=1033263 RepID=A0AAD7GLL8_MYCRO|nr:hypothetical protein B0H17DRAFT_1197830 [Mycena rosella]
MASPKRAAFKVDSPRPILKRPSPLHLASNPSFASSITIVVSPAISSPCTFPRLPDLDRRVHDALAKLRVYSPGDSTFLSVKSPSVNGLVLFVDAPSFAALAETEDKTTKAVRFGCRSRDLGKALSIYPRSLYPSAPPSPMSRNKENVQVAGVARAKYLDSPKSRRAMKRPASLNVPAGRPAAPRVTSPLANKFLTPVAESPRTVTIASMRLNQDFWESITLEEGDGEHYRLFALEAHEEGSTSISVVPRFFFGTKDGLLWSPGLPPKEPSSVAEINIRSAAEDISFDFEKDRSMVTSPGGQPLAYLSIATVLSMDAATITYPPQVVVSADD